MLQQTQLFKERLILAFTTAFPLFFDLAAARRRSAKASGKDLGITLRARNL
jgi:adenine-specific DNA glycosylase